MNQLIMKKTDPFINCEAMSYASPITNPDFMLSDATVEDLINLNNFGFSMVIDQGKVTATGDNKSAAKLIAQELEDHFSLIPENGELYDFIRYNAWSDDVLINLCEMAIQETTIEKAYDITFFDVFEYIIDYWVLTDKEIDELKKRDAEDFREQQERTYK